MNPTEQNRPGFWCKLKKPAFLQNFAANPFFSDGRNIQQLNTGEAGEPPKKLCVYK